MDTARVTSEGTVAGRLRELLGLSRSEWARALGVNVITVDRWEAQTSEPKGLATEILLGITEALAIGADPQRVGQLLRFGGIRSLLCFGITHKLATTG
jgi:transcriptional regulator with XRE-family HTH domain